jgi:hypothetical protein
LVKVTVTRPLPTGRQAFGLRLKGYVPVRRSAFRHAGVNFSKPVFAEAATRRQANDVTE